MGDDGRGRPARCHGQRHVYRHAGPARRDVRKRHPPRPSGRVADDLWRGNAPGAPEEGVCRAALADGHCREQGQGKAWAGADVQGPAGALLRQVRVCRRGHVGLEPRRGGLASDAGEVLRWCFALQNGFDWWYCVERVYVGTLRSAWGTWPSFDPALAGPPSPSGKALATPYKLKGLYLSMIHGTTQSLPLGGRWPRSGRMRATYRKQSVVY